MPSSRSHWWPRMSSRRPRFRVQPWTRLRFRLMTDLISMIHRGYSPSSDGYYLTAKSQICQSKKEIKPKPINKPWTNSVFRVDWDFDFIAGEKQGFTAFFDNELKLHRTKLKNSTLRKAQEPLLLRQIAGKEDFPKLVHVFCYRGQGRYWVISGLGWIRVTGTAKVAV